MFISTLGALPLHPTQLRAPSFGHHKSCFVNGETIFHRHKLLEMKDMNLSGSVFLT